MIAVLLAAAAAGVSVGDDFRHGLSCWRIEAEAPARVRAAGGTLDIDTPAGISLWWAQPLDGPVTIEFDAEGVAAGGANDANSDLNAFWMATDPHAQGGSPLARRRSGAFATYDDLRTYYVGIGGNRNTTTRFRRYVGEPGNRPLLPEHDRRDPPALLVANRWTHIRLVADGGRIAVERDHRPLFAYTDPAPYRRGWFALRSTKSHLRIRHLSIAAAGDPATERCRAQ